MPAMDAPQQQQPMEAGAPGAVITQQPGTEAMPQMEQSDVGMRGGLMEECGCCCCSEEVACC